MAHQLYGPARESSVDNELWFSMPGSARRQQEQSRASEQSAYRTTTKRIITTSSRSHSAIPSISTTADTNKPLPPSPPRESGRRNRKSIGLRSMLGRPPSSHMDPTYLQPEQYITDQRYSASTTTLSIDTYGAHSHHTYTRSMPSSPYEYNQPSTSSNPALFARSHSSAADYPDTTQYQPYVPQSQLQAPPHQAYPVRNIRSTSMNTYFESMPSRDRTFPDTSSNPTLREGVSNRPRPHTWLSPTESFNDPSQFSLFVQATTGLPNEADPFSPSGPPQLQGSLFARRSGHDAIPLPSRDAPAGTSRTSHLRTDWQNFEPPEGVTRSMSVVNSSRPSSGTYQASPESSRMNAINHELQMLGLEDDRVSDEELPDYAQSQAEAHAKKRQEASARARELEARWRNTRGR
jgi:hypothetical protein